ncbi:MAG: TolC family protein [Chitinophagaceae bacterium]|nr:TolC family protein [Chitinophagaceae bacterium]
MKPYPTGLIRIILAIITVPIGLSAFSQGRHELSVRQAVDYAAKNNVQVKNALVNVDIQQQTNREITGLAYPQLNGNLGATYNPNVAVSVFPNFIAAGTYGVLAQEGVKDANGNPILSPTDFGIIQAQFGTKYNANAGLDLSQILFDGQVFIGLKARKTSIDFQKKNVEVTQEQIKANIYKIYYQLVVSKTQIELLDANISRLEKLLSDTREIYKNGFAEKLDVDKVSVQIANLQTERLKALNSIENGYFGLKFLMGMPIRDSLVLTDSLSDDQIKGGLLENTAYQYSDRKEFQYAELNKKLNEFNIRRYKLSKLPTASLNAGYSKIAQRDKFDFYKGEYFTASSVSLRINVPIFNGFATNARIRRAELELQQTVNNIDNLRLSIDNEVEQARTNFRSAVATMDFQRKNMELAVQVYDQTKKKYEMGLGSNIEINAAQTDLKAAQTNYINSLYDAIIARIDFLKATGKL